MAVPAPEEPATLAAQSALRRRLCLRVFNPHSEAVVGGYFAFSEPDGLVCAEGPTVGLEGFEGEQDVEAQAVQATVGLQPSRTYRVCLVAYVEEGAQTTFGEEVAVETTPAPPTVVSESVPAPKADVSANFEAHVNPNNQTTKYSFEYATNAALTGATTVPGASELPEEFNAEGTPVSVETGAILTPHTTYYYRVLAENAKGELAKPGRSSLSSPVRPNRRWKRRSKRAPRLR